MRCRGFLIVAVCVELIAHLFPLWQPTPAQADEGHPATDTSDVPTETIRIKDALPYGLAPINYTSETSDNAVVSLQRKMAAGEVQLKADGKFGYLLSVLQALDVPVSSQVLVFSKTALNQRLIGPRNPRAIYFNDDVYVAWVPGAEALEVAAVDPIKGGMFYLLREDESSEGDGGLRFQRSDNCLACHAGTSTLSVPGFMVRSFLTDRRGKPTNGYSRITHATQWRQRFAGWYVTGKLAGASHLGNLVGDDDIAQRAVDPGFRADIVDLSPLFETAKYPAPHSDIVAQLVLTHQVHGQNLILRVQHESLLQRHSDAETQLLRYLLFLDEAPLAGPVMGTSGFAKWFADRARDENDIPGWRTFDLETRLFKVPISYLLTSRAFQQLPTETRARLYRRLWRILQGTETMPGIDRLSSADRRAVIELVRRTISDLPEEWTAVSVDRK